MRYRRRRNSEWRDESRAVVRNAPQRLRTLAREACPPSARAAPTTFAPIAMSDAVLTADDVGKLKARGHGSQDDADALQVSELKVELDARGLSTKGAL